MNTGVVECIGITGSLVTTLGKGEGLKVVTGNCGPSTSGGGGGGGFTKGRSVNGCKMGVEGTKSGSAATPIDAPTIAFIGTDVGETNLGGPALGGGGGKGGRTVGNIKGFLWS